MERFYMFAGVEVSVRLPDEKMYHDERSLAPFRMATAVNPHRFTFEAVDCLLPASGELIVQQPDFRVYRDGDWSVRYIGNIGGNWNGAYMRVAHCEKEHRVQVLNSQFPHFIGVRTVLNAMAAEHLIAQAGGFVFHCSYIVRNGQAILFTAPSGTGKSTQADLWKTHRSAEIANGDRACIRVQDDGVYACGIPFSGSSSYCENRTLPLGAIVYLAQAPETTIRQLKGYEAFRRVWEGCSVNTWDSEDMSLVSAAVQKTVESVPVFYLACTPDESAVIALEQALDKAVNR